MSSTHFGRLARALAALPILFAFAYSPCAQGAGFSFAVHVGGLHLAGSTCR
jgi:hypothetical protein